MCINDTGCAHESLFPPFPALPPDAYCGRAAALKAEHFPHASLPSQRRLGFCISFFLPLPMNAATTITYNEEVPDAVQEFEAVRNRTGQQQGVTRITETVRDKMIMHVLAMIQVPNNAKQ